MCNRQEVAQEIGNALKQNNKNFDTHFSYIKQSLIDNKEDCKALTETISRHIEKIDNNYCTKNELNLIKKDIEKSEERIKRLEKLVFKTIIAAGLLLFSNLATIIYFLINNFVIK